MQTLLNPFKYLASLATLLLWAALLSGHAHALGEGKTLEAGSAGGRLRDAFDEEEPTEDALQTQDDAPADEAEPYPASDGSAESYEAGEESLEDSEDSADDSDAESEDFDEEAND